jgi:hypothetical protein
MKPDTLSFVGEFSQASAICFSFVTLATLGYDDIAPRADVARGIAIVEGVGDQLFLAVLVAPGQLVFEARGPIELIAAQLTLKSPAIFLDAGFSGFS